MRRESQGLRRAQTHLPPDGSGVWPHEAATAEMIGRPRPPLSSQCSSETSRVSRVNSTIGRAWGSSGPASQTAMRAPLMSRLNWYRISSPGVAVTALAINSEAIRTASSEKRGLTGTRVGEIINCVRSHVANLEAGRAYIDMKQAKALDEAWGLFFARALHNPDWFRQSVEYEMKARILRICQGQTIPVALQSEDYARAVLSMARVADLDKALMERMARQELIIGREDHPLVMVLLDQDALDRPTGGAQVMKAQLQRLLELAVLGSGTRRTRTMCGSS